MDQNISGSFHEVGGIAFEIPPLPDELDLGGPGVPSSASNGTLTGARNTNNEEEFGNFSMSLPGVPSSYLPHSQESSSHRLEQKNDGGFSAFSGFQSNSVAPEFAVPPLPATSTEVTASNAPADLRKAQDLCDPGEFWGFKAAGDSQVISTSLPGDVWSTLPQVDASVEFAAFKDSGGQHSGCKEGASNTVSSEGSPGSVDVKLAKACAKNTGFADFSNFAAESAQLATDDNFGDFTGAEKQPWPTLGGKGNSNDAASLDSAVHSEDFADFGAITAISSTGATGTTTATTKAVAVTAAAVMDEGSFGDFGSFGGVTSSSNVAPTTTESGNADFADFESFKGPTSASNVACSTIGPSNGDFGEFGSFATGPTPGTKIVSPTMETKNNDDFGEFGSFATGPTFGTKIVSPTMEAKSNDDFGEFGSFASPTAVSNTEVKNVDDDFGEFGSFTGPASTSDGVSSAPKSKNADFGEFGSFSGPNSTSNLAAVSATDDYGNFGSFGPTSPPVVMSPPAQQPISGKKLVPSDVMLTCFPATATAQEEGLNCFKQLAQCVKEGTESQQLWSRLVEEAGSSGSLYKWVQSFLQDHFYSAIKVDPMLAPVKPVTGGSFTAGGLVGDDPLSPAFSSSALLAAEFGFERALTTATVPQISLEGDAFGWGSGTANNAPTLLDLSRPESPLPEANQAPLLDKELLGLDFTTVDHNNTGATKESTTATSRVDSEAHAPPDATEGQANQGATQTVEQQLLLLGLDTTKTTWWSSKDGSNLELSLAAKTVLEGLPNLDFLLAETLLVST